MRKHIERTTQAIVLTFILISLLILPSYASNVDDYYKDGLEASGAKELSDYLTDEASGYLEKLGCEDVEFERLLELSPGAVFELITDIIKNGIKTPLKGFMTACGTVLLTCICSGFFPDDEKSRIVVNLICGGMLVTGIFTAASDGISAAVSAMESCSVFEKALIPVLAAVVTACGNPTVAATFNGAAFAAAEFVSSFAQNFAMPLVGISGALGISGAMMPTLRLSAISEMIRKTLTTALASAASLFTAFLALRCTLASSADGLITKGVKLASGTFIPVIGGAIGEAYSSVLGSFGLLKNTVGIYAIIAFFAVCVPVMINLALWVIALRGAGALSDLLDCRVCSEILRNAAFIFSMMNALLILCMAVFVISTGLIIAIKTGE